MMGLEVMNPWVAMSNSQDQTSEANAMLERRVDMAATARPLALIVEKEVSVVSSAS